MAVIWLLAAGALTGAQLTRALPNAQLSVTMPPIAAIPGQAPVLPWPKQGQARLDVEGVGSLGAFGGDTPAPIGSVAKIMTAYVVLVDRPLDAGQPGPVLTITAADVADYRARKPGGESLVEVTAGEQLTQRQALQALLLPSANNIAHLLAKWVAGGAAKFVERMNAVARDLGMTNTTYTDPSGLAPTTVSTATDQVLLARKALQLPVFAETVALPSATLPVAGAVKNYNSLLGTDGVFGVKTGSTTEAGGNLVFAARLEVAGKTLTLIGVVLNQPGRATPEQLAAANDATRKLLAAARATVSEYTVVPAGTRLGEVRSRWGESAPVSTGKPVKLLGWPGQPVTVAVRPLPLGNKVGAADVVATLTATSGAAQASLTVRPDRALVGPSTQWRLKRAP